MSRAGRKGQAIRDARNRIDHDRPDLSITRERALLFGANLPSTEPTYEEPLSELARLADTAGADVRGQYTQNLKHRHAATFVGKGFVESLAEHAEETGASILICDNDLSPAQAYNIEKMTLRRVVDRTELILDIFAAHARTRTAKVAVELAQLEYSLPRLKRLWTHLEQQKGGIGLRGPGETQIEVDRRAVKKKITELRRILEEIRERKEREVQGRKGEFTVSIVGYTNAGKSTLMRALSGLAVKVEDRLFSTLDTKTALVEVRKNKRILLSDTVGFIRNLPHHLVASFHATLEEVAHTDLLLHVVDASNPDVKTQIEAVEKVLEQMEIVGRPTVMVFNKIDLVPDQVDVEWLKREHEDHVVISALTGAGLVALRDRIGRAQGEALIEETLRFPIANGRAIAFIRDRAEILEESFDGDEAKYLVRLSKKDMGTLRGFLA